MDDKTKSGGVLGAPVTRRRVLAGAAAGGVAMLLGSARVFAAEDEDLRIGFISPRSGNLGAFGAADPYILGLGRKELAKGINVGGKNYRVRFIDRDTQSSPSRASQLANELITKEHVNLMLCTSTPETVNPVSDACEAAGVPSLASDCPLESFYFGRGGKPGQPSPFKWSFDFSFGTEQFLKAYLSMWAQLPTNRKVAVMYPNDADGTAVRDNLAPQFEKAGYKVIDPGPYQDGTTDYSSQIALFNRENCQIFNTFPIPPDFNTFWRQAATLHYTDKVVIAQIAKTGLFPGQVEPLSVLGYNLATATFWSPVFPYKSSITGHASQWLADGYEKASGRQWMQQVGVSMALLEACVDVLKASGDPTDKAKVRDAIATLDTVTTLGRVNFKAGPYPNTATTPEIGAQWVKAKPGSKYKLDLVTVEHVNDPDIPIQRKLVPYNGRA
ncbi:MAG TPA: ABC transporter substrate-binding protein [Nevskiaceae bacterium]